MAKEKIGVIGSGISGIIAAYLLQQRYDVILFEKNNRLGGKIGYYLMDKWKMHEIDSLDDLALCEFLFTKKGLDKE